MNSKELSRPLRRSLVRMWSKKQVEKFWGEGSWHPEIEIAYNVLGRLYVLNCRKTLRTLEITEEWFPEIASPIELESLEFMEWMESAPPSELEALGQA